MAQELCGHHFILKFGGSLFPCLLCSIPVIFSGWLVPAGSWGPKLCCSDNLRIGAALHKFGGLLRFCHPDCGAVAAAVVAVAAAVVACMLAEKRSTPGPYLIRKTVLLKDLKYPRYNVYQYYPWQEG